MLIPRDKKRSVLQFLFSQNFADGLRTSFLIITPAVLFSLVGEFQVGLTVAIGAACINITDIPGPARHKRNGMLYANALVFFTALLTGFARYSQWATGILVIVLAFAFSMLAVYGNRAAVLGTAGLFLVVVRIGSELLPMRQLLQESILILCGGLWYMLVSLAFLRISPYSTARRALGECIHEISHYLRRKSRFYNLAVDMDENYRQLLQEQTRVNEYQELLRELLFKSRLIVKESTPTSRMLVLAFVELVDFFEQITAIHFDYDDLRQRYAHTGTLEAIEQVIEARASVLNDIGLAVQINRPYPVKFHNTKDLEQLRALIETLPGNNFVLGRILVSLQNLDKKLQSLAAYFNGTFKDQNSKLPTEHNRFVNSQSYRISLLLGNLTRQSNVFRHAIRMAVACVLGLVAGKLFPFGNHSYWILLTIIVILKPGFSLTRQRNYQRLVGTIAGGLIGVAVLMAVPYKYVQFGFLILFAVIAYSFQRRNYIVMVLFITPYLLIMFHLVGVNFIDVAEERILDTAIGCAISIATGYLLLPAWEAYNITGLMAAMLKANINYLLVTVESATGGDVSITDYRLARKETFVNTANLAAAFQRMTQEPRSKQLKTAEIHQFVVLNNILSSNIASLRTADGSVVQLPPSEALFRNIRKAVDALSQATQKLDPAFKETLPARFAASPANPNLPDKTQPEPGSFIVNVSQELLKLCSKMHG